MGFALTLINAYSVLKGQQLEIILGDDWTGCLSLFASYNI